MKAITYCRVSTAAQEDRSSLESQATACNQFAGQNGYKITRTVKETFSGAYLFDRPLLNEIRAEVRRGQVDAVIVYAIDRLTRDTAHLYVIQEELERYNCKLISVTEDFDTSPEGKLLQSVRGYVGEVERVKIRERTTRGRLTKARNGTLNYRRKLFGYQVDEDTGKRVLCSAESRIVRRIFDLYLSGHSLREITHTLTVEGVPTPQGRKTWWANSIHSMFKNPAYAGRTTAFRYKHEIRVENGVRVHNGSAMADASLHVVLPDITPAIVTVDEFDAVQMILERNRKEKRRAVRTEYLLRGMVGCAACGRKFSPIGSKSFRAYVCTSKQTRHTNCGTKMLNAVKAEEGVWQIVVDLIKHPEYLQEMIERAQRHGTNRQAEIEQDVAAVNRTILKAETELRNLVARAENATDDVWQMFNDRIIAKQAELNKMRSTRDDLLKHQYSDQPPALDADDLLDRFGSRIDRLTFSERITVLKSLGLRASWDGTHLKANIYVQSICKGNFNRLYNNTVIKVKVDL